MKFFNLFKPPTIGDYKPESKHENFLSLSIQDTPDTNRTIKILSTTGHTINLVLLNVCDGPRVSAGTTKKNKIPKAEIITIINYKSITYEQINHFRTRKKAEINRKFHFFVTARNEATISTKYLLLLRR